MRKSKWGSPSYDSWKTTDIEAEEEALAESLGYKSAAAMKAARQEAKDEARIDEYEYERDI